MDEIKSYIAHAGHRLSVQNVIYPTNPDSGEFIVEYDIVLSKVYRVPVLYVHLPDEAGSGILGMEFIHQHLITKSLAPTLDQMGIMGGVTMTVGSQRL